MSQRPVVLLTDFGIVDDFGGVCHGVIAARAPQAQVIHLTHGITPQSVLQGALVLRNTLAYMPQAAVHLAVVDPGVGTDRRALAVDCADGRSFVGPDNGLLAPAVHACGGAVAAVQLDNPEMQLHPVAPTFHGRDVFAPAAAHLATGGAIADLGTEIEPRSLTQLDIPAPVVDGSSVSSVAWNIDRYGNVALLLDQQQLESVVGSDTEVELVVRNDRFYASRARTFANVRVGAMLLYEDPYGSISLAINRGNAAEMFRMGTGQRLTIRRIAG